MDSNFTCCSLAWCSRNRIEHLVQENERLSTFPNGTYWSTCSSIVRPTSFHPQMWHSSLMVPMLSRSSSCSMGGHHLLPLAVFNSLQSSAMLQCRSLVILVNNYLRPPSNYWFRGKILERRRWNATEGDQKHIKEIRSLPKEMEGELKGIIIDLKEILNKPWEYHRRRTEEDQNPTEGDGRRTKGDH